MPVACTFQQKRGAHERIASSYTPLFVNFLCGIYDDKKYSLEESIRNYVSRRKRKYRIYNHIYRIKYALCDCQTNKMAQKN